MTNGDYIRSMTDEALVDVVIEQGCFDCPYYGAGGCTDTRCDEHMLAWIKQERSEG